MPIDQTMQDPSWPEYARMAGFLAWLVLSGAGTARWLLGARGSRNWVWWSPALGIFSALFTVNLASWLLPGAAGVWVGLVLASLVAFVPIARHQIAWPPALQADRLFGAALLISLYLAALASRTQTLFTDEPWHLPLAATIANGHFPPVSPFTPDVGAAYHYSADLLASTGIIVAGIPPWFAFYFLNPFITLAFIAAVYAFARDLGARRWPAASVAFAAGYGGLAVVNTPAWSFGIPALDVGNGADWWTALWSTFGARVDAHPLERIGPAWLNVAHITLGFSATMLIGRLLLLPKQWPVAVAGAVAIQMVGLGEASQIVAVLPVVAIIAVVMAIRSRRWSERVVWPAGVIGGTALVVFGGGAITDGLFRGAGGGAELAVTGLALPALGNSLAPRADPLGQLGLGWWSLAFLAVAALLLARRGPLWFAGAAALLAGVLEQTLTFEGGEAGRFLADSMFLLGFIFLVAVVVTTGRWQAVGRLRWGGAIVEVALVAFVVIPSAAPRFGSSLILAADGIETGFPRIHNEHARFYNPSRYSTQLANGRPVYAWMRANLPAGARILTPWPAAVVIATGMFAPMAPADLPTFWVAAVPWHDDALRHGHRADLEALGVDYYHVLPGSEPVIQGAELLVEISTVGGQHRVYRLPRDAGTTTTAPHSYRALQELTTGGRLTIPSSVGPRVRESIWWKLVRTHSFAGPTFFKSRSTRTPHFEAIEAAVRPGLVALPGWLAPTTLGQSADDAVWSLEGVAVFRHTATTPRSTMRITPGKSPVPLAEATNACTYARRVILRVLGQGTLNLGRDSSIALDGLSSIGPVDCGVAELAVEETTIPPFVDVVPTGGTIKSYEGVGAIGFDGGIDEGRAVVNIWYLNLNSAGFAEGTELRLYRADDAGLSPLTSEPSKSIAWWQGPIILNVKQQVARLAFDVRVLEVNDAAAAGTLGTVTNGIYLLALTIAGFDAGRSELVISNVVPLVVVDVEGREVHYRILNGIVAVRPSR